MEIIKNRARLDLFYGLKLLVLFLEVPGLWLSMGVVNRGQGHRQLESSGLIYPRLEWVISRNSSVGLLGFSREGVPSPITWSYLYVP